MLSTRDVLWKPAATTNMVAMRMVFTLENPDRASPELIQPVAYRAVMETMAVTHMGILLRIKLASVAIKITRHIISWVFISFFLSCFFLPLLYPETPDPVAAYIHLFLAPLRFPPSPFS